MHEADFEQLGHMMSDLDWTDRAVEQWRIAGAPPEQIEEYLADSGKGEGKPEAEPDRTLTDGEVIPLAGRTLRTVFTPGHTPGHACFYIEEHEILFSGDHVLAKTTPHVGEFDFPVAERDALGEFLASLDAVGKLPAKRTLPAHRQPIDDLAARTTALIEHHEERLDDLYDSLGDEGLTLWEATSRMKWYRPWGETLRAASRWRCRRGPHTCGTSSSGGAPGSCPAAIPHASCASEHPRKRRHPRSRTKTGG